MPPVGDGKFCWWEFFLIGLWEPEDEWLWPFELLSKLKASFCKYWPLIKIKISVNCVYKEYEGKINMVHEQLFWLKDEVMSNLKPDCLGKSLSGRTDWEVGRNSSPMSWNFHHIPPVIKDDNWWCQSLLGFPKLNLTLMT